MLADSRGRRWATGAARRLVQWLIVASVTLRAGDRAGPYELPLGPELVRQFAAATLDDSRQLRDGRLVPPGLVATQAYGAERSAIAELVPEHVFSAARSGVHGQHELLLHRSIASDESLHTFVETHSARSSGGNLRVTLRHATSDDRDELVAEQWWTTVLLGTTSEPTGPELPNRSFPEGREAPLVADVEVWIDEVVARRYAQVSGDHSDHHFSVDAARRSGFAAPILHGLCTMALCSRVATETVAGGDPGRIRRVAVRFAAPAFLGRRMRVQLRDVPGGSFRLEASCGDDAVITNGLVELVP